MGSRGVVVQLPGWPPRCSGSFTTQADGGSVDTTTAEITMDAEALERLVNPHGYNATVVLRVSDDQLPDVLRVLEWPDDRSWVTRGASKSKKANKTQPHRGALYFRRGSVNLSGRKPRDGRLPTWNGGWGSARTGGPAGRASLKRPPGATSPVCGLCGCPTGQGRRWRAQPEGRDRGNPLRSGISEPAYTLKRKSVGRKRRRAEVAEERDPRGAPRVVCAAGGPREIRIFPPGCIMAV